MDHSVTPLEVAMIAQELNATFRPGMDANRPVFL